VDHVNADCLVDHALRGAGIRPHSNRLPRKQTATPSEQVPGRHRHTRVVFRDANGTALVEQWTIHQSGHAWAGGDPHGSYADPRGPDASAELVRFFDEHAKQLPLRQQA
jgi:poly(3-hydroxybutyrate) depolymerase